jgi:hypothetical protein
VTLVTTDQPPFGRGVPQKFWQIRRPDPGGSPVYAA